MKRNRNLLIWIVFSPASFGCGVWQRLIPSNWGVVSLTRVRTLCHKACWFPPRVVFPGVIMMTGWRYPQGRDRKAIDIMEDFPLDDEYIAISQVPGQEEASFSGSPAPSGTRRRGKLLTFQFRHRALRYFAFSFGISSSKINSGTCCSIRLRNASLQGGRKSMEGCWCFLLYSSR